MKSTKNLFRTVQGAALFMLVIATGACQSKKDQNPGSANVSAPAIDIHTAVITNNSDAVRQHIAAGTDINTPDPFGGSSPLISAAVFGKTDIARILIEGGANLNFQNNDGSTALHSAAFFCRPEIVAMLLEKGADKTIRNNFKATAHESMLAPFDQIKPVYEMMEKALGPMGLTLDYSFIEKTRPQIAEMLK